MAHVPRPARGLIAEAFVHVTARGNERRALFADDADYAQFLLYVGRAVERSGWRCVSYCLMPNHYHLLLEVGEPTLPKGMGWLNGAYAQYFNARRGRNGHVFGGRYHALEIHTENHLASACCYVDLNPVRAGLCVHPREWPWSGYRAVIGEAAPPAFLDVAVARSFDFGYEAFVEHGLREWKAGQSPAGTVPGAVTIARAAMGPAFNRRHG